MPLLDPRRQRFNKDGSLFDPSQQLSGLSVGIGGELERLNKGLDESLFSSLERFDRLAQDLTSTLQDGLAGAISATAASLPDLLSGTASITGLAGSLIGDFAQRIGQAMIAFGVSGIAIRSFITNPAAAILAGGALIGIGAALKASAQRQTDAFTGGSFAPGAAAGPRPAAVSGFGAAPQRVQVEGVVKASGRELTIVLANQQRSDMRAGRAVFMPA